VTAIFGPHPPARMLLIETRVPGRKARPLDRWSVPLPPSHGEGGDDGGIRDANVLEWIRAARGGAVA
jgi:hypothetical protein